MALFAFDTEDDSKGSPYLFNFYDVAKNDHHTFRAQHQALDFVLAQRDSRFWATNLEYDLINLFRGHYGLLEYTFAGSRMLAASIKSDNLKFYDTLNHWPLSVKKMGERLGIEKLEYEHTGEKPKTLAEWNRAITYCRRDTEITGKFVYSMWQTYERAGIDLKMTMASSTLDYFERHFHGRKLTHPFSEEQIDFFHQGYYGGRTEIFFNAPIEGRIFYHDLNSLYPSVMRDFKYPDLEGGFSDVESTRDKPIRAADVLRFDGMCSVTIRAPKRLTIPYLPCRNNGHLVFPTGSFRGVYTLAEIRAAKKLGYRIEAIHRAVVFEQTYNPFTDFIEKLYRERLAAQAADDQLMNLTYKGLMNYCYGKFAQRNESTKLIPLSKTKLKPFDTVFGDLVFRREKILYPKYANCIWAAHVTAYARDRLHQALSRVEGAGGLLIYCDTDSVIYEHSTQILEDSKELGKFKLEGVFDYAHFKLPKLYTLRSQGKQTYKAKGVPGRVAREFFENGRATYKKPTKLREALRRNLSPKRKVALIPNFWDTHEKEIQAVYNKRTVLKGGRTVPLNLSQ